MARFVFPRRMPPLYGGSENATLRSVLLFIISYKKNASALYEMEKKTEPIIMNLYELPLIQLPNRNPKLLEQIRGNLVSHS